MYMLRVREVQMRGKLTADHFHMSRNKRRTGGYGEEGIEEGNHVDVYVY